MNGSNGRDGMGLALLGISLIPLIVLFVVWLVSAIAAALIADDRGRSVVGFFLVTFFFLGPLGPGFALLAGRELNGVPVAPARREALPPEKRKIADGRQRFICPRCGAENDVPNADTDYDCWRCGEHRNVKPKIAQTKKT